MLVVSEISRFTCIHMLLVFISEYPTVGPPTFAQLSLPLKPYLQQRENYGHTGLSKILNSL